MYCLKVLWMRGLKMHVLVTGTASFISSHVAQKLLGRGDDVIGIDSLNDYYSVELKRARLAHFKDYPHYTHIYGDLADRGTIEELFERYKPQRAINLAAQAGVRYAAENPHVYAASNVNGFLHILEGCRHHGVDHLVFASTSSIYGADTKIPFLEHQSTGHPLTFYAASKKVNEAMAHAYAHLYGFACTGLRFFTVYGPWGRPDMALFLFTKAILAGEEIKVFNYGHHRRSFTYVDDIVEGVVRVLDTPRTRTPAWNGAMPDPATSGVAPYRLFNIGQEETVELLHYIEVLEHCLGKKAKMKLLPLQPGDVSDTEADVSELQAVMGYCPKVTVEEGVRNFVDWYKT